MGFLVILAVLTCVTISYANEEYCPLPTSGEYVVGDSLFILLEETEEAPENFICTSEGVFSDPDRCERYHVCFRNESGFSHTLGNCGSGYHYDYSVCGCLEGDCFSVALEEGMEALVWPEGNDEKASANESTTEATTTTQMVFECPSSGLFEDVNNCTRYYACDELGNWANIPCYDGEYFDPTVGRCVDGFCTTSTTVVPTTEASFRCPDYGIFEDVNDCTRYYACDETGYWVNIPCEDGQYFDPTQETCTEGVCSVSTTETATTELIFECDGQGIYEDVLDCTRYYVCDEVGHWLLFSCDSGQYFDPTQKICLDGVCPESTTITTTTPFECYEEGIFEDVRDCTKFYACDDIGNWVHLDCSDGEYFDPSGPSCVEGICPASTTQMIPTTPTPFECESEGYFSDQTDCTSYYVCDYTGIWVHLDCPDGQYFNPSGPNCVEGICPASTTEVILTTSAPFECEREGYFEDENDCTKYFVCDADLNSMHLDCPVGQYFVPDIPYCVEGICPEATTESLTTRAPFRCEAKGYFADEYDCTSYYVCDADLNYLHMQCPEGTVFDENLVFCVQGTCSVFVCNQPGLYADEADCSAYYTCDANLDVIHEYCPEGEYFNTSMQLCMVGTCAKPVS